MKKRSLWILAVSLLASCALLAGCSGGGGESSATPTDPPGSTAGSETTVPPEEPETTAPQEDPTTTAPEETPTTEPQETPTTTTPETPATEPQTEPTDPNSGEEPAGTAAKAAEIAKQQLGKPYRYGAAGPDDFDNSGLLYYCYGQAGIAVPRRTGDIYRQGTAVEKADLQPGDAVFFWNENEGNPEFAAIYVGDGICIAARQEGTPVSELDMNLPYFEQHYTGARRYSGG